MEYEQSIFQTVNGVPVISNQLISQQFKDFVQELKSLIGVRPQVNFWMYRTGNTPSLAYDLKGSLGSATLTMLINGNAQEFPTQQIERGEIFCTAFDAVDAYYFVSMLSEELEAIVFSGPSTTTNY